ncbi:MAG: enoyl-CoA hydratase-related protein [Gemmatimonadetes bacterium]|nr:enoyl-CoA hydratase-related protein [Gemmatimonadota bacterium]
MSSFPVLPYTVDNGIVTLTLNRPEKRNALNQAMIAALKASLERAATDDAARVVVITGRGQDFCAGADLAELEQMASLSAEENLTDAMHLGALFLQMRHHPLPILAIVKGRALAGGCGLATACDIVLARDDSEFGYPEIHLGFVPAMVMAILRRRVPEARAFELVVSGDRISATDAERLGLVTRVFPAFTFYENVKKYMQVLVQKPRSALSLTKKLLYEQDSMDFESAIRRGAEVNVEARMSEECREGVRRFLEKSKEEPSA